MNVKSTIFTIAAGLLLQSTRAAVPQSAALAALTDAPVSVATTVQNVVRNGIGAHVSRRVKLRGVATYQVPGHFLYMQDGNDGIELQSSSTEKVAPGQLVEAEGYPMDGDNALILQNATFKALAGAMPSAAKHIDSKNLKSWLSSFGGDPHEELVNIDGTVIDSRIQDGERIWILRQDGKIFQAHLPLSAGTVDKKFTTADEAVSFTGIARLHATLGNEPAVLDLLVRSPNDLQLVASAPFWRSRAAIVVLLILIVATLMVGLLDIVQTRNVREQTRIIRESEQRFRDMAECDVLTGLPNRLTLQERIVECLSDCDREGTKAAVLTIDIDRFKQINDTFGHLVGDECLKAVSQRLKTKIRTVDTIARTGGEEFTVIIGRLSSSENAHKVCTTLLHLFKEPLILSERGLTLTVSIGAAMYPDDGTDSETLRKRSDQALYEAKRTGRNKVVFASQELSESSEMASLVEAKLREDLRFNRFRLYFQPICDSDKNICRFEALLRSPNMHLAKIGPGQFIPIAEESGLIVQLGQWVIREVCKQIAEWRAQGLSVRPVAVNVSGRQLIRKEFVGEVLRELKRYNIQPEMLELELTETTIMNKLGPVAEIIAELAQAGVTFSIDDFGTGYSSLSRLNQLPIKGLKIDASFVRELELESGSYTIVRAVIQMAKSLGLNVVAEGIEDHDKFEILKHLGCDLFQGYLIGKPVPAEDAILVVEDNRVTVTQNQANPHWSSHLTPRTTGTFRIS